MYYFQNFKYSVEKIANATEKTTAAAFVKYHHDIIKYLYPLTSLNVVYLLHDDASDDEHDGGDSSDTVESLQLPC